MTLIDFLLLFGLLSAFFVALDFLGSLFRRYKKDDLD